MNVNLDAQPPRYATALLSERRWPLFIAALLLLGVALGLPGIASLPLDSHEIFVAQTTREMAARGDWIVPYFNGSPRLNKPPLNYWATAVVAGVFGRATEASAWHTRLVSLLAGLGIVGLTLHLGRRWYDRATSLLASSMLVTSLGFVAFVHDGKPDMLYAFWVTAGLACASAAVRYANDDAQIPRWPAIGMWACYGLAILTKGPHIPLLVLVATVVYFFARLRDWRVVVASLRPLLGLLVLALISLPWWWFMHTRVQSMGASQLGGTLLTPELTKFGDPYYLYRPLQLVVPWLAWILLSAFGFGLSRERRGLGIFGLPLLTAIIGLSFGRQYRYFYMLPLIAPMCLLIARGVMLALRGWRSEIANVVSWGLVALQVGVILAAFSWALMDPARMDIKAAWPAFVLWALAVAVVAKALPNAGRATLLVSAMTLLVSLAWIIAAARGVLWSTERFEEFELAQQAANLATPAMPIMSFGVNSSVYVYYTQRQVDEARAIDDIAKSLQASADQHLLLVTRSDRIDLLRPLGHVEELGRFKQGIGYDVLVYLRGRAARPF